MRRISTSENLLTPNPAANSNWLSFVTFWYTIWIFKIGLKRDFDEQDLTNPLDAHNSGLLGYRLAKQWSKELDKTRDKKWRKPSLFRAIVKTFGLEIAIYGIFLGVMELGIRIFQPLFVGLVLRYFSVANRNSTFTNSTTLENPHTYFGRVVNYFDPNQGPISKSEAAVFSFGIIFCGFVAVLVQHPVFCLLNFCGMKIRIAVCSLIYRKILRLDYSKLTGKMIGNVINILSNDVNKFENIHFIHYLWLGPATVAASLYFIYREVGEAAFYGMGPVLACIPLQVFFAVIVRFLRVETAIRTDNRVQVMNEIIQGIRVIKMYAWEYTFTRSLDKTRKYEMHSLIKASAIKGIVMSLILFVTRTGHFVTVYYFLTYTQDYITIETVFFIVSFYQILRMTMTVYYPQGMGHVSEIYVALIRIHTFLMMKETLISNPEPMDPNWLNKLRKNMQYASYYEKQFKIYPQNEVIIQNASLKYGDVQVLQDISFEVKAGVLTTLVGAVGSGKSCTLQMILGELQPYKGSVIVNGHVSFATQDPFLFAGSVRQNILFGSQYDRRRYRMVVRVCALSRDFSLLPYGDRTLVGEKGISLSGGQRARINLARCVYRDADIYLLDDPLSAVDTNVGKQLFEECITGYLRNKFVILATHQLQYLKNVPQIVFLEYGRVRVIGNYAEVFSQIEGLDKLVSTEEEEAPEEEDAKLIAIASIKSEKSQIRQKQNAKEFQEMRSSGVIGCVVLKNYYRSGGSYPFIFLLLFLFLLSQTAASIFDYFMSLWSKVEDRDYYGTSTSHIPESLKDLDRSECVKMASGAIIATTLISLIRSFYFYGFCMRASISLHNRMFQCVTRANLRFFTLNASGRILNRFSKDMSAVDEMMPYAMVDTYQILLNFVGAIGLLIYLDVWLFLLSIVFVLIFYIIRKYYLKASTSLKRLEGIARSPVFTHSNATMQGLPVIRAHSNEMVLVEEFDKFQDIHTSASFMFMGVSRAFGYLLDLLTVVYTGLIIYYFLVFNVKDSSVSALILTQCIGLTGIFQWGMRQSAEFETQLTAVERVLEFTTIEPEPPLESAHGQAPPLTWPARGQIEFKNVYMRYALTEQPVLKNVSFVIAAQEKIGIVGRTGAGKSSVIGTLFRLAYIDGSIFIDGIETGSIGLHDLRKKISIIPQEPVLFSGTLRYNLDPFQEFNDVVLYSALTDVDLKLAESPDCLNEMMSEGGVNLSVGSRQLVCLARAIVRNNKILIMDEATANVDVQTDHFIQSTIRSKFAHCTVLTIAHRLNTIMDSDRVLVMDSGEVMEFEHPFVLMQNPNSMFSELIAKTGAQNRDKFWEIAEASFEKTGRSLSDAAGSEGRPSSATSSQPKSDESDNQDPNALLNVPSNEPNAPLNDPDNPDNPPPPSNNPP